MTAKAYVAYVITWTESERGWGQRPDGASLHLTQEDVKKYIKKYWDGMPDDVPHEYSKNDGTTGDLVVVSSALHKKLKLDKNHSMRLWQREYINLKRKGEIRK